MARRSRLHLPSAIYHIMLRGNDGQSIFLSDEDRCRMCFLLQEGIERFGHSIHAFCFMTNHIHLAIQVHQTPISNIMQNLAFRYARYFNKKYDRIGHLFQGRFKSIIVDGSRYLKELVRYIHLNPVRADLVKNPEEYKWSSHRNYLLLDDCTWITNDSVLKKFSNFRNESIINYQHFIWEGIGAEPSIDFKIGCSSGIVGDEEFIDEFLDAFGHNFKKYEISLAHLVKQVCSRLNLSPSSLQASSKYQLESYGRAILAFFVQEIDNLSLEELGLFLFRDPSGLGKLANRLEKKRIKSQTLNAELQELRTLIYQEECPNVRPDP